jgi:hypothetical protein
MLPRKVGPPGSWGHVRLRNAQVIGVVLALLVGVLAVTAPLCLTTRCPDMALAGRTTAASAVQCVADPAHHVSPACDGMRAPAGRPTAVAIAKAPVVDDVTAVAGLSLPSSGIVRAAYSPPLDEPPRLVLDTSRLRI